MGNRGGSNPKQHTPSEEISPVVGDRKHPTGERRGLEAGNQKNCLDDQGRNETRENNRPRVGGKLKENPP